MTQPLTADAALSAAPVLPPCNCTDDPIAGLKALFVDYVQANRIKAGQDPARRPVFLRLHGAAHGRFVVNPELAESLQVGVFQRGAEYPVWVRFSSDLRDGLPDLQSTVGIGLKLFEVDGEKILAPDEHARTHDFLLQNFDVFFVDTARDMCEFTYQSLNGQGDAYLKAHPKTKQLLAEMKKPVPSVLETPYWSGLPFKLGDQHYVKYKLEPEQAPTAPEAPNYDDPNYLGADLRARLKLGEVRFRFMVQLQTSEQEMPLDAATHRWDESRSAPIHVATLILPQQNPETRGQSEYGETLAFNTWHALPEHAPVGSIAEARKAVYQASADLRRNVNGSPLAEPTEPRPAQMTTATPYPAALDTVIVRAAIHPAIGVARLGNSDEYYIGPQVPYPNYAAAGSSHDKAGALKRQAAEFRIYGYNAAGEVVRELTADWAEIEWTAHVANKKAAWYRWRVALDLPEATGVALPLRNANVKGAARRQLVIDDGPRTIKGRSTSGTAYRFEGHFLEKTAVYLGEVQTDAAGRLLFLAGKGVSGSPAHTPIYTPDEPDTFANADGWYDDTCDGPITAQVVIDGRPVPVAPAWVLSAPPDYAPGLASVRTLYDLLWDANYQAGIFAEPTSVSFTRDIYPILQRLTGLQWVNQGFAAQFGWGGTYDFTDVTLLEKLAWKPQPGAYDRYAEVRRQLFNTFRPAVPADGNPRPWPWVYGDYMDEATSPAANLALSGLQMHLLHRWAAGDFVADWGQVATPPRQFADVPLADQPATLDQAALHFCLADAFHPGCEVTWPIRHLTMFAEPFRIRHRPATNPEPSYGSTLTPAKALSLNGPLYAQGPGHLTRWMAVPWQMDTAFCRSGYDVQYDPYLPTFWPARVPNQMLSAADYQIVMDPTKGHDERMAAFARREQWVTRLGTGSAVDQMMAMVAHFGKMGVAEMRPGVPDSPDFPAQMLVESELPKSAPKALRAAMAEARETLAPEAAEAEPPRQRAVRQAGWASQEHLDEALTFVRRNRNNG